MTTQTAELDPDIDEELEEAPTPASLLPRVAAELFGTFVLVTAIIVVAAFGALGAQATALHIALAGGLALAAMVAAFGSVSGSHLNPAVSLGAAIAGRLSWADLVPYIVAQTLGAVAAGGLLRVIIPSTLPAALGQADTRTFISTTANGFGSHSPMAGLSGGQVTFSTAQALVVEAVATAVLVAVVLAVTRRPNPAAPLAIGGALTVSILVAAQVTNAAINPARATASAFFSESWAMSQLWLFWVAPLLGGAIVGLVVLMIERNALPVEEWDEDDDEDEDEADEPQIEESQIEDSDQPDVPGAPVLPEAPAEATELVEDPDTGDVVPEAESSREDRQP